MISATVPRRSRAPDPECKEVERIGTPQSRQMWKAHHSGVRQDPKDVNKVWVDLEFTFRHLYFEQIPHLYNIQRLKRAQGLPTKVQIPNEGYWTLPDWDRSEPLDIILFMTLPQASAVDL